MFHQQLSEVERRREPVTVSVSVAMPFTLTWVSVFNAIIWLVKRGDIFGRQMDVITQITATT